MPTILSVSVWISFMLKVGKHTIIPINNVYKIYYIISWKARTRLGGCHTQVRHGPTRDAASDAVSKFFFFFF